MKNLHLATCGTALLISMVRVQADAPAAIVTVATDKTMHSATAAETGESAHAGTVLHDGEFVKTGKTSLAEVVLANKTVTRLGPSTIFNYSTASHEANLQSGTILFSKPKDGKELTIKSSAVTAAITGTTGFVERDGTSVMLGVIEGTVHVTVGTARTVLHAGNMLMATGTTAQVVSFDVPDFVKTSVFFSRFQQALPNAQAVEKEIATYQELASRGFIAPTQAAPPGGNHTASVAEASNGHERAGSSAGLAGATIASSTVGSSSSGFAISGASSSSASLTIASSGAGISSSGAGLGKAGTGSTILGGANSYSGGIISGGALTTTGGSIASSGATLSSIGSGITLSGANAFTGGTTPTGGTLNLGGTSTFSGGTITIGSAGTLNSGHGTVVVTH